MTLRANGSEDLTTELARTLAENIRLEDAGRAWEKVTVGKPEPRVSHVVFNVVMGWLTESRHYRP